jgi:hypothetical protein
MVIAVRVINTSFISIGSIITPVFEAFCERADGHNSLADELKFKDGKDICWYAKGDERMNFFTEARRPHFSRNKICQVLCWDNFRCAKSARRFYFQVL